MEYKKNYLTWTKKVQNEALKSRLEQMKNDDNRMQMCFSSSLLFGTAGLRGVMDAGTNCMNVYTVAQTSQGVAKYILNNGGSSVAISYDSRNNSELFAKTAAYVFANCGVKVYMSKELMPTPYLSYMTRKLHTYAAVMITASHNSKEYNGYKVYCKDGYQLTDEQSNEVYENISCIDVFSVEFGDVSKFVNSGMIEYVGEELEIKYLKDVFCQHVNMIEDLTVAYTPLNGAGYRLVPQILKLSGLKQIVKVVEQAFPNGNFTTCSYPNPEKAEAMALGIKYAKANNVDILLATDPDCDRVGVAVRDKNEYIRLNGQEIGILLTDFLLSQKKAKGTLSDSPVVIKTIVTTVLLKKIVADYGGSVVDLLTGFKYIGEYITKMEKEGNISNFVIGFEESCGYLVGTHVRDKDAVVTCMLIAEMASFYKKKGLTLIGRLEKIYQKYGRFENDQISVRFEGADGSEKMQQCVNKFRNASLRSIGGLAVESSYDLLTENGLNLPKSNVLIYNLENDAQLIVRPSGTEPLVKFYLTAKGNNSQTKQAFEAIKKFIDKYIS